MRNTKWYRGLILSAAIIITAAGCQSTVESKSDNTGESKTESTEKENKTDKINTEAKKSETVKEENKKETTEPEKAAEPEKVPETDPNVSSEETIKKITLYLPNDDATGFIEKEVELEQISPDALIGQLVGEGALTDSITVQNFEESEDGGRNVLNLDLSSNFQQYIMSMGSAGEQLVMGAVINTFLDAYGAEGIKITIDGNTMETGHTIYEGYQSHMGS